MRSFPLISAIADVLESDHSYNFEHSHAWLELKGHLDDGF